MIKHTQHSMYAKILKFFVFVSFLNLIGCTPEQDIFSPEADPNLGEEISGSSDFKTAFLVEINFYRSSGCKCGNTNMPPVPLLKWNDLLEEAATRHTNDMSNNNHFDHQGTDGSSSSQRVSDTGYNWRAVGENIAFGYTSISSVVAAWIDSEGHCKNIMNEAFTEMGVSEKNNYWTQSLARPQ